MVRWVNVTDLGPVLGASYIIAARLLHIRHFFAVALHERPRSLRNLCLLSLCHFVVSQVCGLIPAFTLPLSFHGVAIMDKL